MWVKLLVKAILFIAFVPGVLITLPSPSSERWVVLAVHAVLYTFVSMWVWSMMKRK
jgi:hypothetical protein